MFEITKIFGRISTGIMYKQRNEVANLAKYVHMQGCIDLKLVFQSQNIKEAVKSLAGSGFCLHFEQNIFVKYERFS